MKPQLREEEGGGNDGRESLPPNPIRLCSRIEASVSTPPLTTASPPSQLHQRSQTDKLLSKVSPQSRAEQKPRQADHSTPGLKRRRQHSTSASEPRALHARQQSWYLDEWLCSIGESGVLPQAEDSIPNIADDTGVVERDARDLLAPDLEADIDQMPLWSRSTNPETNSTSNRDGKLNVSSAFFRGVQRLHGIIHDNQGRMISPGIQDLLDKHIRKCPADSPRLGEEDMARILQSIDAAWNGPEATVSHIIAHTLFPVHDPALQLGGNMLWSSAPLPYKPVWLAKIPAPKPDYHVGFPETVNSNWSVEELTAANHAAIRPYVQPGGESLFPSYLFEIKSETTNGTLYAAENQLASAGSHRVNSMIWLLDQIEPGRTRLSTDALVFSQAVNQRETVAYVHWFNPEDGNFYMSYLDNFYFAKDVQKCCDHAKNVQQWMINVQQPVVRDILKRLYPITMGSQPAGNAP